MSDPENTASNEQVSTAPKMARELPSVEMDEAIWALMAVRIQDDVAALTVVKRKYDQLLEQTDAAIRAKTFENQVAAMGQGEAEDDLPDTENVLEYVDDDLSLNDLKKKYALYQKMAQPVFDELAKQQADLEAPEVQEVAQRLFDTQAQALSWDDERKAQELKSAKLAHMEVSERAEIKAVFAQLPAEVQVLKVLYDIGERDLLVDYLVDYHNVPKGDPDAYTKYLEKISAGVDQKVREKALLSLMGGELGATKVSDVARKALLEQPAAGFKRKAEGHGMMERMANYARSYWAKPEDLAAQEKQKQGEKESDLSAQDKSQLARADKELSERIKFADLPAEDQEMLLELRAFIIKLNAYLQLSDIDHNDPLYKQLNGHYNDLQNLANNALLNQQLDKVKEDFARIKDDIAAHEGDINTRVFRERFYTPTNVKAGSIVGGGLTAIWFMGSISNPVAAGLAVAAMGGFYKDAADQARAVAAENVADERDMLKNVSAPSDYDYIHEMDELFGVKSGAAENIPVVEQTIGGQMSGAAQAAARGAKEAAEHAGTAASNAFFSYLQKNYPGIYKMLEFWTAARVKRLALIGAILLITLSISAAFPPFWPVFGFVVAIVAVGTIAWAMGVPVGRYATKVMEGAGTITRGINNAINFTLKPVYGLVASLRAGNTKFSMATIGIAVLAAVSGAVLLPAAFPAMAGVGLIGAVAGAYLGLSVSEIAKEMFVKPMQVQIKAAEAQQMLESAPEIKLSNEQSQNLDNLYRNFADMVLKHFNFRHEDLAARIEEARKLSPPELVVVEQLNKEVKELEIDWLKIREASDNPQHLCEILDSYLKKQYVAERDRFVHEPETKYTERIHKSMHFGATEQATANVSPVGPAPKIKMEFSTDFVAKRAQLKELRDLKSVADEIGRKYHVMKRR